MLGLFKRKPFLNHKKFQRIASAFTIPQSKTVSSRIVDSEGRELFHLPDIEAPENFSQLAVDIAASKYFRKGERSIYQLVERVVRVLRAAALEQNLFDENGAGQYAHALRAVLLRQVAAFNSPVWFNVGVEKEPQASACFIQSVKDDLFDLFDLLKNEARLFKFGSGTGTNFSNIRGVGEPLSRGGSSSGLMSFLEVFDRAAGATRSGGITRRAAKMVVLDMDHPEIEAFINWKLKEEKKAKVLIQAGYSADFNGEAYHTVSGQNSNNSCFIPDSFMHAVEKDLPWSLRARVDGRVVKNVKAKELFKNLATAAHACADPGVQFQDTINRYHTCANTGPIRSSNPCSEYFFLDDSACNLASINLSQFLGPEQEFDWELYQEVIELLIISQELLVGISSYPTQKIKVNSHRFRPLGLGFANLGGLLMRKCIPYDSEEARQFASELGAFLTGTAYRMSGELARALGAFQGYQENKSSMTRVLDLHRDSVRTLLKTSARVQTVWDDVIQHAQAYGMRNAQVSVMAPTGTIGLFMDCDTLGVEPEYTLVKLKKLSGGGSMTMVNQSVKIALQKLGYSAKVEESLFFGDDSHIKSEHRAIFACAARGGSQQKILSVDAHLLMLAAIQPFVSGGISKTVNLPAEVSVEDVEKLYFKAWKLGLKSCAIYRDGSKGSQPMNAMSSKLKCTRCGFEAETEAGCTRCLNCGSALGCG